MKRFYCTFSFFLLLRLGLYAQPMTDGNVGIGEPLPLGKLHISQNAQADALIISNTATQGRGIKLKMKHQSTDREALYIQHKGQGTGVFIDLDSPQNPRTALAVKHSGNGSGFELSMKNTNNTLPAFIVSHEGQGSAASFSSGGTYAISAVSKVSNEAEPNITLSFPSNPITSFKPWEFGVSGSGGAFGIIGAAHEDNDPASDHAGGGFIYNDHQGNLIAATAVAAKIGNTMYNVIGHGVSATIVKGENNQATAMFSPVAPEILLQDYGTAQLNNGHVYVDIDPILKANIAINPEYSYHVFLQARGNCNGLYVNNYGADKFEVIELNGGQSNVSFSYMIVAHRQNTAPSEGGFDNQVRFPNIQNPYPYQNITTSPEQSSASQ